MKYRFEIDGLRAIAVIPVILFHAGFDLFSGGFVGVDIFFVISGYLITSIIINDLENNNFSILNFYERRARRILPALYFMIIISTIIGWFILTPYFYRDLFQTITATSLFTSNYLLYLKSGYFAPIAELKPFLHTWSLAVEEQYYVIFPILFLLFWRLGKNTALLLLVTIFFISFVYSILAPVHPNANFLLLPSRAWELLAGALVAFYIKKRGFRNNNFFSILGLLAILISVFVFDRSTPFPSFYTLFPIVGTMLIIVFANEKNLVAQLLRNKLFVSLGLISYSLYLWHQPIFAFLKHLKFTEPNFYENFCALLIILLVSTFSWKFIEGPFRNKNLFNKKKIFLYSFTIIAIASLTGFLGHYNYGFVSRLNDETKMISEGSFDKNPDTFACNFLKSSNNLNSGCLLGSKNKVKPTMALIGDSHADHLLVALNKKLVKENLTSYNFSFKNCGPANFIGNSSNYEENLCFQKISDFIENNKDIRTIILSFRWVTALPGPGYGNFASQKVLNKTILNSRAEIIAKKIENFSNREIKIILIYPVPEAGEDVPNFTVKKRILGNKNFILTVPYSKFFERNKYAYQALDSISKKKKIVRIYPSKFICGEINDGDCETVINGRSIYYDDDHLSNFGASFLIPSIVENL